MIVVRRLARSACLTRVLSTGFDPRNPYKNEAFKKGIVHVEPAPDSFDYSLSDRPVTAAFGSIPCQSSDLLQYSLSSEQQQKYLRDGYIADVPVLSTDQCDLLLRDYEIFMRYPKEVHPGHGYFHEFHHNQSGDSNNVLLHALGHWRITPHFHDLIYTPAITIPAAQLIRGDSPISKDERAYEHDGNTYSGVRFWHDQLFAKPALVGGNVAWHQDYSYWIRTTPMQHLTVHIALDDQTVENGAIAYIPCSHRWHRNGMPLPITDQNFGCMDSIKQILTPEEIAEFKPKVVTLKKGHAAIHHPFSVHGSYANRSPLPRRACVLNYFANGTRSNTTEPLLHGLPVFSPGSQLVGRFFPLVFDPAWFTKTSS